MIFTNKYTETFQSLFAEAKNYLGLQKKYLAMEAAEKLTILLSAVAIAAICLILGAMVLLFATFALAYWIGQLTDSLALGFLSIAAMQLLGLVVFYRNRSKWVLQPLARFMINLFTPSVKEDGSNDE